MNRRSFFTNLLKAAAGATVAYSFPSIIVPKNIISPEEVAGDILWNANKFDAGQLTYAMLEKAYNAACMGNKEPDFLIVNKAQYERFVDKLLPTEQRYYKTLSSGEGGFMFRGAAVLPRDAEVVRAPDEISSGHDYGKHQFIYGENC